MGKSRWIVQGLKTSSVTLGPSRLTLKIERARAVLSFLPVQAFGGSLQGDLIANNRNGLSVAGKLQFANIEMREALGQLAGYDKLNGEALGTLEFLGVGNSMDQIMRSLDGKGNVELGKGFFTGFDLQAIMDPNGGNGGTTIFEGLSASLRWQMERYATMICVPRSRFEGRRRGACRIGRAGSGLYLYANCICERDLIWRIGAGAHSWFLV